MGINRKTILLLLLAALLIVGAGAAVLTSAQDAQPGPNTAETENEAGEAESLASASEAVLSEAEAIAIAEAERGSTASFVELERENGIVVYSVALADGSEVEVNGQTGDILEVEGAGSDTD